MGAGRRGRKGAERGEEVRSRGGLIEDGVELFCIPLRLE